MQTLQQLESDLKLAGFTEYFSITPSNHEHAISRWELKARNDEGKIRYFVHAFLYKKWRSDSEGVVEFEAVLYQWGRDGEWMILQLHGCSSVKSAISFFSEAYDDLGCELDRHN